MSSRRISVEILADASQFERQVRAASAASTDLEKNLGKAGSGARNAERDLGRASKGALAAELNFRGLGRSVAFASAQFVGAAGFVEAVRKSVNEATNLEDQLARTEKVFKSSAGTVTAWSKTSAQAMGLSQSSALEAANTIGTLLENVGRTPAQAAAMSKRFVQLASDMAAFKKVDPNTALNALEAGLQGRTRSLKQFGITIDNAALKEEAYRTGIAQTAVSTQKVQAAETKLQIARAQLTATEAKYASNTTQVASARLRVAAAEQAVQKAQAGATGQLTAQQKALAAYNLILDQTKGQQGAFAKSGNELNIVEQKLHAEFDNIAATVGTDLLPIMEKYGNELEAWLQKEQQSGAIQRDAAEAAHLLTAAIHDGADVVKVATSIFHGLSDAVGGDENAIKALIGAFLLFKGMPIANAIAAAVGKVATIGTAATVAEGEVGGLRAALIGLGGPEVLAALAAAYGAYKLIQNASQKTTVAPASYGPQLKAGESIAKVQNDIGFYTAAGQTQSQGYFALVELEKLMQKAGTVVSTAAQVAAATKKAAEDIAKIPSTMATDASGARGNLFKGGGAAASGSGQMSQQQIYQLLVRAGFSPDAATNFVGIAEAESGGYYSALNAAGHSSHSMSFAPGYTAYSPTADYSGGLFQENFYKSLGPARTQRYALQFGLNPNMSPTDFVQWLRMHPEAQAKIAYDLSSGGTNYSPWKGDAYVAAHPELLTGGGVYGTTGSGLVVGKTPKKPKKPPIVRGSALLPGSLTNALTIYAGKAADAATSGDVAHWLALEQTDLLHAEKDLRAKLHQGSAKQQAATKAELTAIKRQLDTVNADLAKAKQAVADDKFASAVKAQVTKFVAGLKPQSARYEQLLVKANYDTGQALVDDYDAIAKNLESQKSTLEAEVAKLTADETGKDKKQKAALAAQIARVQSLLSSVSTKIQSNVQSEVNALQSQLSTMQSKVSSGWSAYSGDIVSAWQAGTNTLLAQLAADPRYYQNGALTPSEALLAQMQQKDQAGSLQQALEQAKQQLATDLAGTPGTPGTPSDGTITTIPGQGATINLESAGTAGAPGSGPDAAAIKADNDAIAAAQRQIDEYNLSIEAQKERADADRQYADAVQQLTDKRTQQENELTKVLSQFGDGLQNGTLKLSDLQGWLNGANPEGWAFGLNLDAINQASPIVASDFGDLSTAAGNLLTAFNALIDFVNRQTGANVPTVARAVTPALAKSIASLEGTNVHYLGVPQMAVGGYVRTDGLIYAHAGETVVPARVSQPYGGGDGGGVHLHFYNATVIGGNKDQVARDIKPYLDRIVSV